MVDKIIFYTFRVIFFGFLVLIFIFGYFFWAITTTVSEDNKEIMFNIPKGSTLREVSENLKKQSLIKSSRFFLIYTYLIGEEKIMAGEFRLTANMSIVSIVEKLTSPQISGEDKEITILEGWSMEEIAWLLDREEIISYDYFMSYVKNPPLSLISKYPDILGEVRDGISLEGYLFPDTYKFFIDSSPESVVYRFLDNLNEKLSSFQKEISKQSKTVREIIILSSILEKEVRGLKDKKIVADIFYKRIKKGMPLQADSTVNYITKKGIARSSYEDIESDNPYNTYKYVGLPPGPIGNPGMDSILASINPTKNDYYFFLTSKEGKVYYGRTFDEHIANRKYME